MTTIAPEDYNEFIKTLADQIIDELVNSDSFSNDFYQYLKTISTPQITEDVKTKAPSQVIKDLERAFGLPLTGKLKKFLGNLNLIYTILKCLTNHKNIDLCLQNVSVSEREVILSMFPNQSLDHKYFYDIVNYAIINNYPKFVELAFQVNPKMSDFWIASWFSVALYNQQFEVAESLIKFSKGLYSLMSETLTYNSLEIIPLLINQGVDPSKAFQMAFYGKNMEVMKFLLTQYPISPSELNALIKKETRYINFDTLELLIKGGADPKLALRDISLRESVERRNLIAEELINRGVIKGDDYIERPRSRSPPPSRYAPSARYTPSSIASPSGYTPSSSSSSRSRYTPSSSARSPSPSRYKPSSSASSSSSSSRQYSREELTRLTVVQLKEILRSHRLAVSGLKSELIDRILNSQ